MRWVKRERERERERFIKSDIVDTQDYSDYTTGWTQKFTLHLGLELGYLSSGLPHIHLTYFA